MTTTPRFAVDANVERLSKWLCIMGYDAAYYPQIDDNDLVRLALAKGRVILTEDNIVGKRRLATTGVLKVFVVTIDNLWEQIYQMASAFGLGFQASLSRCLECNEPLLDAPKESVKSLLPPYVRQTQEEFVRCPACGKVYWKGTHWSNMRRELDRVQGGER